MIKFGLIFMTFFALEALNAANPSPDIPVPVTKASETLSKDHRDSVNSSWKLLSEDQKKEVNQYIEQIKSVLQKSNVLKNFESYPDESSLTKALSQVEKSTEDEMSSLKRQEIEKLSNSNLITDKFFMDMSNPEKFTFTDHLILYYILRFAKLW